MSNLIELEKRILGACVYKLKLIEIYRIDKSLFNSERFRDIFEKMVEQLNKTYDKYHPEKEQMEYIRTEIIPYKADEKNIPAIIESIQEIQNKELLCLELQRIMNDANDIGVKALLADVNNINKKISFKSAEDIYTPKDFKDEFDKIINGEHTAMSDIGTGYKELDKKIYGLQRNSTTLFSAPTGYGKTAFALNIARSVAKTKNVLYINLEMNKKKIVERFAQMIGEIEKERFENPDNESKNVLRYAKEEFMKLKLKITSGRAKSVDDIILTIRNNNINKEIDLVVIDYIGRISDRTGESNKEHLKFKEWVKVINEARANDGNYHVWILSQLNREAESMMSDGKEVDGRQTMQGSYNMLAEPDNVFTWYCHKTAGWVLHCDKNRDGEDGWDMGFNFYKPYQQITEKGLIRMSDFNKKKAETKDPF